MGKMRGKQTHRERIMEARAKLERLAKEQNVPAFDFDAFLRDIREEGFGGR